jgi:hypothetical protein
MTENAIMSCVISAIVHVTGTGDRGVCNNGGMMLNRGTPSKAENISVPLPFHPVGIT